ncbi:MAG TPA: hemolysin III family protein [Chryseosolibacter sp.]|nr:hemolysin III family protein [Chryseosolibacter sp.]
MSLGKTAMTGEVKLRLGEEIANAITHGIGAALAIAGFVVLILFSEGHEILSYSIYGVALVMLYLASTLYHSLVFTRVGKLFRKFDHMAIFLLIAGTYTPFCLHVLHGWLSWVLLGTVWLLATAGIVLKAMFTGRFEWLSTAIYILTGWLVIFAIKPIYQSLPLQSFVLLIAGGLAYTIGTAFYVKSKIPYFHMVWHLWVLAGSILHFFSILTLTEL